MGTDQAYYVYVLFRENGMPFYIGKGKGRRWNAHEWEAARLDPKKRCYRHNVICNMRSRGIDSLPKIKLHEGLTEIQAHEYERALIKAIGRYPLGPLVNMSDGGEGSSGYRHTPENRKKIATDSKRMWADPARRTMIVASQMGKKRSPETRARMSNCRLGKKLTSEHRRNISLSHVGKVSAKQLANLGFGGREHTPDARAKISAARKATVASDAARANMSKAATSRLSKLTPEEIALQIRPMLESNAWLGRRHSDETRAKLRAAWLRRKLDAATRGESCGPNVGRTFCPEARARMSAAAKARRTVQKTSRSLSV